MKIYTNELGHMTNMATLPIYGKNLKKSSSPFYALTEAIKSVISLEIATLYRSQVMMSLELFNY